MTPRLLPVICLCAGALSLDGCATATVHSTTAHRTRLALPPIAGNQFIRSPVSIERECALTASVVGYRVPCPEIVPRGTVPGPGPDEEVVGPDSTSGFAEAPTWRGWVFGSSTSEAGHLVIQASPRPVPNLLHAVDGGGFDPRAPANRLGYVVLHHRRYRLVTPIARLTINGWHVRIVVVSMENDSTALRDHVAMVWTTAGHTYVVGFHDLQGVIATEELDKALVRGMRLVS